MQTVKRYFRPAEVIDASNEHPRWFEFDHFRGLTQGARLYISLRDRDFERFEIVAPRLECRVLLKARVLSVDEATGEIFFANRGAFFDTLICLREVMEAKIIGHEFSYCGVGNAYSALSAPFIGQSAFSVSLGVQEPPPAPPLIRRRRYEWGYAEETNKNENHLCPAPMIAATYIDRTTSARGTFKCEDIPRMVKSGQMFVGVINLALIKPEGTTAVWHATVDNFMMKA